MYRDLRFGNIFVFCFRVRDGVEVLCIDICVLGSYGRIWGLEYILVVRY